MLKYKILVLSIFLLTFIGFISVNAKVNDLPLSGRIIYLDAGHGGYSYVLVH